MSIKKEHQILIVGLCAWILSGMGFLLVKHGFIEIGKPIIIFGIIVIFFCVITGQAKFFRKLKGSCKKDSSSDSSSS